MADLATKLKAPKFWDKPNLLGKLLSPLGLLYQGISSYKQSQIQPFEASIPVIAIGNVTLGGAGKTPVTIALANLLKQNSETPHILSRGYGSEELREPTRVDPDLHSALMVGDEPLLLAHTAPTWVYPERGISASLATDAGASLLLMDDGLQHASLAKDISFLVIDTSYRLGNGHVFPAGPLREPFDFAVERSSAIVALGADPLGLQLPFVRPVFRAMLVPTPEWAEFKGKPVIAFAGIARPQKFFTMCEQSGIAVVERHEFPDHHPYTRDDARRLIERARMLGATLVCTEKDAVKFHPDDRPNLRPLGVSVTWQDEPALKEFLLDRIAALR